MLPADKQPPLSRIRENADLLDAIRRSPKPLSKAGDWLRLDDTYGDAPNQQTLEFLYEVFAEQRRERCLGQGVFLSTAHSVKGMEFAHPAIIDGGWAAQATEEQRRLFLCRDDPRQGNLMPDAAARPAQPVFG
jgi:ATP-dependent DNA helicase RecQ